MDQEYFEEIVRELKLGATQKGHPFQCFSLATKGLQHSIGLRTVVLRKVSDNLTLSFYTDQRSAKIAEIKNDNSVCALFYHPGKKIQLKIWGDADIESDPKILNSLWNVIPKHSRKDYTTSEPPGSNLTDTGPIEYLMDGNHFALVHILPQNIEFLQLGKLHHTRILFSRGENGWKHQALVP